MKKSRALWVLALFVLVALPFLVKGAQLSRTPEVKDAKNSQTMHLLESYLNINPTSGVGGAQIAIVDKTALQSAGGDSEAFMDLGKSGTGQISVYVVRQGDTLSEIAEMFGVSANTIIWANDIRGSSIRVGQELVILPISGVRHTVKSGDTLQSIAKKYKANLDDIISYNGFTANTKLKTGDVVIIPDGVITSAPASSTGSGSSSSSSFPTYSGYYLRPISGGKKSQGIHGHNAVDLASPVGTSIVAAASGQVIVSRTGGYNGGYGTYVVIAHDNGTQTVYAHMDANYVSIGQTVSQGERIGTIGMTGNTTGPHVHFEVRGAKNPF